jgi:hypothetical protein
MSDDVTFVGPMGEAAGLATCMEGLEDMSKIVEGVEVKKAIVEGEDVCLIYDLFTVPAGPVPTAGLYHVTGGKIDYIRAFFDARPLMAYPRQRIRDCEALLSAMGADNLRLSLIY